KQAPANCLRVERSDIVHPAPVPKSPVPAHKRYDAFVKLSRVIRILILILIIAGVVYAFYPPFRFFAWALAGRSPVCPLEEAVKAADNLRKQVDYKDQILNASKLVEQDPKGFELWETPNGRYWIPAG